MAKRKNRRSFGGPSVRPAFAKAIQEIAAGKVTSLEELVAQFGIPQSVLPGSTGNSLSSKPPVKKYDRVHDWTTRLEALGLDLAEAGFAHANPYSGRFSKVRIYASGEFQGVCQLGNEFHHFFIDPIGLKPPVGCDCEESSGDAPCIHTACFVEFVLQQLRFPHSEITKFIKAGELFTDKPDRSRFKIDRSAMVLARLGELSERVQGPATIASGQDTLLPPIQEIATKRLIWNVEYHPSTAMPSIEVTALVQQEKKRGGGFTKGKAISWERLKSSIDLELTDADRKIIALAKHQTDRYGYGRLTYVLENDIQAAQYLIGQDNVRINGLPGFVKPLTLAVNLNANKDVCQFAYVDGLGKAFGQPIVVHGEWVALLSKDDSILSVGFVQDDSFEVMKSLTKLPSLPTAHLATVGTKARQLQSSISLFLPESIAGPVVIDDSKFVLLLRSRADGKLDYGLRVRSGLGRLVKPSESPCVYSGKRHDQPVQFCRDTVHEAERAAEINKQLEIDSDTQSDWNGTISDFEQGLHLLERIQSLGDAVEVLWDKTGEKPMSVLGTLNGKNVRVDISAKRDWFGISGECDFGDKTMPLDSVMQNLSTNPGEVIRGQYMQVGDGQWAKVSSDLRKRLLELRDATHTDRKNRLFDATAAKAVRSLMQSDIHVKASKAWFECLERLDRSEKLDPQLPSGLQAELRDYQLEGFKWMRRLAEWGVGGVLADDMGLGKTVQALAVVLDRMKDGPALVIAPTSVGFNWAREAARFAPELRVHLYRETDREEFLTTIGPGDLVIASYGLALREGSALAKVEWGTLILDEAQAVKNSRSKTSQTISTFDSKWTVALTGTPMENHLGELWSLFSLVSPGVFGGWESFRKRFAVPIEKNGDDESRQALAHRLQPFILRRTKAEVLTELPARTEMTLYVDLTPEERAQYEQVRKSAIGEIDAIGGLPEIQDQRFKILALLTRLRQFACHPGLVNKAWTGSSAKLDQLCETLENLREEGHRALIFSQFTEHLALIKKALDERGFTYEYLDGSTPAAARQERVDSFQNGTATAFLISLKAGGTGLNLTAADYVIHMDPWWNPAVEDQATDRAHRFGQTKPVMVYRVVARGTIEEEILALHETKRDLVEGVLAGTGTAAKLSTDELIGMLRG